MCRKSCNTSHVVFLVVSRHRLSYLDSAYRCLPRFGDRLCPGDVSRKVVLGLPDNQSVYVLGKNDAAALFYALYQVGNLADKLVDEWTEGLQKQAPACE
jgi:hypothetical protein